MAVSAISVMLPHKLLFVSYLYHNVETGTFVVDI